MKTCKSLLVKFLTVLCALCLSLSVAFGLVACGEEEVKSVVGAEINSENKLVLIYSDGTKSEGMDIVGKDGVDGEDGKDGVDANVCEHKNYEIIDATEVSLGGKYDNYCKVKTAFCIDCKHTFGVTLDHVLENVDKIEPTCTTDGVKDGKKCACGYITEGTPIPKLGHTERELKEEDIKLNTGKYKCKDVWYTGTVCSVCHELLELVQHDPIGHQYDDATLEVGTVATDTVKATLKANCSICCEESEKVDVIELYNLVDGLKDEHYSKKVVSTENAAHYITCTYTYNEKEFEVCNAYPVAHENLVVNDYTAEKYSNIIIKTDAPELTCKELPAESNAAYYCEECNRLVNVKVKLAHTKGELISRTNYCYNTATTGTETYDCTKCDENIVVENVPNLPHKPVLDSHKQNDTDPSKIDLTFVCECKNDGCTWTKTETVDPASYKPNTCCTPGEYVYNGETVVIPASGDHTCATKDGGTVKLPSNFNLTDYDEWKDYVLLGDADDVFECGKPVKQSFICVVGQDAGVANCLISGTVTRNHDKVYDTENETPATCTSNGSKPWTCSYCKVSGADDVIGKHVFEFVSVEPTTEALTVKCTTENGATTVIAKADYVKSTENANKYDCQDYANGLYNYNEYKFTVADVEYSVKEKLENFVHVLNGKNITVIPGVTTISVDTPNVYTDADAEPANCATPVAGGFVCGNHVVNILVTGSHIQGNNEIQHDPIDCEVDSYKYYICTVVGCPATDNKVYLTDADGNKVLHEAHKGHTWVITGDDTSATKTVKCSNPGCDVVEFTVSPANSTQVGDPVVTCSDKTTTYKYVYTNGTYTQDVIFKVVEIVGSHNYLSELTEAIVFEGKTYDVGYVATAEDLEKLGATDAQYKIHVQIVDIAQEDGSIQKVYATYCAKCGKLQIIAECPPDATPTV